MMNTAAFNERIMDTVLNKCKPVSLFLAVALVLLVLETIYLFTTKTNAGFAILNILPIRHTFKNRFSTKSQITLHGIVALILISYLIWIIVPAYQDIHNSQYCQITAQYIHKEPKQTKVSISEGHIWVETQDGGFYLELPADWTEEEFPYGTYHGIISYGKASRILTSFICQSASE